MTDFSRRRSRDAVVSSLLLAAAAAATGAGGAASFADPRSFSRQVPIKPARELPDMMSASEGEGGSWKSGCSADSECEVSINF